MCSPRRKEGVWRGRGTLKGIFNFLNQKFIFISPCIKTLFKVVLHVLELHFLKSHTADKNKIKIQFWNKIFKALLDCKKKRMKKWYIYYFFHFSFTITHNFQRWNKVVFTYVSKCCKHVRWHQDVEENSAICPLFLGEEVSWKLFDGSWSTVDKGVQFPSNNCKWTKTARLDYGFQHLEIIWNDWNSFLKHPVCLWL